MKKLSLLLVALLVATLSFAQEPLAKAMASMVPISGRQVPVAAKVATPRAVPVGKRMAPKKAESDYVVITTQPEGELVTYARGGSHYYVSNSQLYYGDQSGTIDVVFGADKKVYFKDIVSGLSFDTWVEGRLSDDETSIVVPLQQNIKYVANYDACIAICWVVYNSGFSVDESVTEAVFTINEDKTEIALQGTGFTSASLGAWWTDDHTIQNYGDYESDYTPYVPPVELPEGVEAEAYVMSYTNNNNEAASTPVNVAVDGNDVYFQGLSSYIPEAWVKGTMDGNTVTFPAMQYLGTYSEYDSYAFYNGDAVFTYDADADTYSAEGTIYNVLGGQYYDGYYVNPVLKKAVEKAATPADPEITGMTDGSYGWYITFNVPLVDVNGDPLVADKLSYMIYTDVEGEVNPLTFTPETHTYLTEEMTEIPYGFTENYDFYSNTIYLNDLYSEKWNKIGIQSIYYGGDEENATEIQWFEIKPYSIQTVTFDFNAMDVPTSSGVSTDGDITETQVLTEDNVTLAISPKEEGKPTENRYWSTVAGPQLRVYSGTLTFSAPLGYAVKEIVFNTIKWNAGNSFDSGECKTETTGEGNNTIITATWTGEAQEVVMSVAGNSQINSIDVTIEAVEVAPVEAPADLETEEYLFTATKTVNGEDESVAYSNSVLVGFDGSDVYVQGICEDMPEAWIKGTLKNGVCTFAANQYLGTYTFWGYEFPYFFNPNAAVAFVYDSDAGTLTAQSEFEISDGTEMYYSFADAVLTKIVEVAGTPETPEITELRHSNSYGYYFYFNIPLVDTEGNAMVPSKLYWRLVSEVNGEQAVVTLRAADYENLEEDMTEIPYGFTDDWDIYADEVYLNMSEAYDWDRVGIQAIYYGGDEENVSEIAWVTLKTRKTITLDANGYSTFCDGAANYYVESEDAAAYALTVDNAKGWRVVMSEIVEVPAGNGALIKGEPNAEVVLATTPFTYQVGDNDLIAAVEDVTDFEEGTLVLGIVNGQSGFYKFGGQVIPAGKAYLAPIPEAGDSKLYLVFGDEEVTGIDAVVAPVNSDSRIYNLNGQRVNKAQKGIYIINGKKVVLK